MTQQKNTIEWLILKFETDPRQKSRNSGEFKNILYNVQQELIAHYGQYTHDIKTEKTRHRGRANLASDATAFFCPSIHSQCTPRCDDESEDCDLAQGEGDIYDRDEAVVKNRTAGPNNSVPHPWWSENATEQGGREGGAYSRGDTDEAGIRDGWSYVDGTLFDDVELDETRRYLKHSKPSGIDVRNYKDAIWRLKKDDHDTTEYFTPAVIAMAHPWMFEITVFAGFYRAAAAAQF